MALDSVASAVGILGLVALLVAGSFKALPPLKPLAPLLLPQALRYALHPLKLFKKTDLNHHLIAYLIGYRTVKENRLNLAVKLLTASTCLLCASVLFEVLTGQNVKHLTLHTITLGFHLERTSGLFTHPLTTAGVAYTLFVLLTALYALTGKKYLTLPALLLVLCIVFTQSRSYWLAVTFFFSVYLLASLRQNRRLALLLTVVAVTALMVFLQTPVLRDRLKSIGDTKHKSNITRLMIWKSHLRAFANEYSVAEKLFGAGDRANSLAWKHFPQVFEEYKGKAHSQETLRSYWVCKGETHNIYLRFLTRYGLLGVAGYLLFWGYILYLNITRFPYTPAVLFCAGYLGFLLAGAFENNFVDAEVQFAVLYTLGINLAILEGR